MAAATKSLQAAIRAACTAAIALNVVSDICGKRERKNPSCRGGEVPQGDEGDRDE